MDRFEPILRAQNLQKVLCGSPGGQGDGRASEQSEPQPRSAVADQNIEPAHARLLLFCAHHVEDGDTPVAVRLRLKELPRLAVGLESLLERRCEFGAWRCSNEYRFVFLGSRPSKARAPAGRIRPSLTSSAARRVLTALQMLAAFRGVNRIV